MAQARHFQRYIGIDLGGAKGKSTALACLARDEAGARVETVLMRAEDGTPWTDDALLAFAAQHSASDTVIAVNAPLTRPACLRCSERVCPGQEACQVQATVWLRTRGQELQAQAVLSDRNRIVAMPETTGFSQPSPMPAAASNPLPPYTHRCTEVALHFEHKLLSRDQLGQSSWAIASRAIHLRRRLAGLGFALHDALIEVSPRCTIQALFGEDTARSYKRDADPWQTRADIVEGLRDLEFAAQSRLSREDVLRNDNCFDALISGYTAYLRDRDQWTLPSDGPFEDDGWIWAPPQ